MCLYAAAMDLWPLLGIAGLLVGLVLVPFGIPGTWLQVFVLSLATIYGRISLPVLILSIVLAVLGEVAEYVFVKRLTARYGGSRKAFWGALAGGMIGVFFGLPIPVVGSIVAGIVGSFVGAALVAWLETRDLPAAGRVGWGVILGRVFAAAAKLGAGVIILVAGAADFLLR